MAWFGWLIISVVGYVILFAILMIFYSSGEAASISFDIWLGFWILSISVYFISKLVPNYGVTSSSITINADIETSWKIITNPMTYEKLYDDSKVTILENKKGQERWKSVINDEHGSMTFVEETAEKIKNESWIVKTVDSKIITDVEPCPYIDDNDTVEQKITGVSMYRFKGKGNKTKVYLKSKFYDDMDSFSRLITLLARIFINTSTRSLKKYKKYIESLEN